MGLTMAICFTLAGLFLSINLFKSNFGYQTTQFSEAGLILGGLRYFPIIKEETTEGIVTEDPKSGVHIVSVKNERYETISSFKYTFEDTLINKVQFLYHCFSVSPGRFISSYFDGYMLISNVYFYPRSPIINYKYGAVDKKFQVNKLLGNMNPINLSGENIRLGIAPIKYGFNSSTLFEQIKTSELGYMANRLSDFNYVQSPNIVTKSITNKIVLCAYLFSYLLCLLGALPIFIFSIYRYHQAHEHKFLYFWGSNIALSFTSFSYFLLLTASGSVIDRYAFPGYVAMMIVMLNLFMTPWWRKNLAS
jgi:hypothetical protein